MPSRVNDFEPSNNNSSGRFGSDRGVGDDDQRILSDDYTLGNGVAMRSEWDHGFSHHPADLNDRVRGIRGTQRENHSGKGPKGWKRSDETMLEEACEALFDSPYVDASEVEVSVENGCVYLTGQVESREMKREAEMCVERVPGVTDVRNALSIIHR